ncbi:uncharacterized protein [Nicotiana tomentosiformis]|uniref:uncharacterized protein n=1 Tax=Nicotiana tomentosiformis TaxID=4098 RepID=UPI00388CA45F
MADDEQRRLERFGRLLPPSLSGPESYDSQERGEREAKRLGGPGDLSGVPSRCQFYRDGGHTYTHAQTGLPVHCGASSSLGSYSYYQGQSSLSALPAQSSSHAPSIQGSSAPGSSTGRSNSVEESAYDFSSRYFTPRSAARGGAQSVRGRPRGGGQSGGGQARFYVIPARPDVVASDAVITGFVLVFHREASILFDPGSTYSYVSSYFAHHLDMPHESLVSSIHVSTPVGDTIIVDRVYPSCEVTIGSRDTRVDLSLLGMVDFDVILGMDWLSPYHVVLDCHSNTVALAMLGLSRIEWRGSLDYVSSRVISYLKAQRMVGKGCLSYLAFVRNVSTDAPTIDSILVVREFSDVFPADLPDMPPDRDIDFGIDWRHALNPFLFHHIAWHQLS